MKTTALIISGSTEFLAEQFGVDIQNIGLPFLIIFCYG